MKTVSTPNTGGTKRLEFMKTVSTPNTVNNL